MCFLFFMFVCWDIDVAQGMKKVMRWKGMNKYMEWKTLDVAKHEKVMGWKTLFGMVK